MGVQQNYAKFDSRMEDSAMGFGLNEVDSYHSQGISAVGSGSSNSFGYYIEPISRLLLFSFVIGYTIYLLIITIKRGPDAAVSSLSSLCVGIKNKSLSLYRNISSWRIFHIFARSLHNRLLWIVIGVVYFVGSGILSGDSSLLRIDRIPEGMVGVNLRDSKIIQSGYHIYSPLISRYFLSPTNTFDFEIGEATANTSEELAVTIDRRVGFEFLDNKRLDFYKQYGPRNIRTISSDIVMPSLLESIKKVVYTYSFKDLLTQSDNIKEQVLKIAQEKLAEKGIELKYLNIVDIRLPKSYLKSKEALLNAENDRRLAEAALETQKKEDEKLLLKAESEKKIKVVQAEAIAEYNRIVSEQNISQSLLDMRKIDIEEMRINKWDGKMPQTVNGNIGW